MSVSIYRVHSGASQVSDEGLELWKERTVESVAMGIVDFCAARILSLAAALYTIPILVRLPVKAIVALVAINGEGISGRSLLRTAIAVNGMVLLAIARVGVSLAGAILPEAIYGSLRMHEHLLWAGLYCRAQFCAFPERIVPLVGRYGDQRLRCDIVNTAIARLHAEAGEGRDGLSFVDRIWSPAIRDVQEGLVRAADFAPGPDERLVLLPPEERVRDFLSPVVVPHPALPRFMDKMIEAMRASVGRLISERLYTKKEIGEMSVALAAVYNTALLDVIVRCCSLNTHGVLLFDGEPLEWANAGRLSLWGAHLKRIVQLYASMPEEERKGAYYYLCVDDDRVKKVIPDLGEKSESMRQLFFDMGKFRTGFIEKEAGSYSQRLLSVFDI
jgi:hypothetical protein